MINIRVDSVWRSAGRRFLFYTMLLLKAWNTGAQGTVGWPEPRSMRTRLDGCASKNTHQSRHITSPPSHPIGWSRRQGRGNSKNRCESPFWLNEPMRHQCFVQVPPLSWLWLRGEEHKYFWLKLCLHKASVCISQRPRAFNTCRASDLHDTHINGRLLFILREAVKCKQSSESQRGLI